MSSLLVSTMVRARTFVAQHDEVECRHGLCAEVGQRALLSQVAEQARAARIKSVRRDGTFLALVGRLSLSRQQCRVFGSESWGRACVKGFPVTSNERSPVMLRSSCRGSDAIWLLETSCVHKTVSSPRMSIT